MQLSRYADAQAALKHPELKQALYDAGAQVMADALITLHGEAHSRRRRCEYQVFNRRFFRHYEEEIFPATLNPVLAPYLAAGRADLVELGYRATMNLTADFAGIDRTAGTTEETEDLLALVKTFSLGATLVHHTGERKAITDAVDEALATFDSQFLQDAIERRRLLQRAGEPLPNDVLSTLLADKEMRLTPDVLRREMAFYLQAGAHSTANSTTHAFHEIVTWCIQQAISPECLLDDLPLLQRCVHESLRLHPASPVAWRRTQQAIELAGQRLPADTKVVIDLHHANRDATVFGDDADTFNPDRVTPPGVPRWGLTFGTGIHACLGRALDGGLPPGDKMTETHQLGIVSLMIKTLLEYQARPIASDPARKDDSTSRDNWGYYPVSLKGAGGLS